MEEDSLEDKRDHEQEHKVVRKTEHFRSMVLQHLPNWRHLLFQGQFLDFNVVHSILRFAANCANNSFAVAVNDIGFGVEDVGVVNILILFNMFKIEYTLLLIVIDARHIDLVHPDILLGLVGFFLIITKYFQNPRFPTVFIRFFLFCFFNNIRRADLLESLCMLD